MEHLELDIRINVPFVCNACMFRESDTFHDFPRRWGWKLNIQDGYSLSHDTTSDRIPGLTKFNEFLQSWIFFGLLTTVAKLKQAQLRELYDGGQYIGTGRLNDFLKSWKEWEVDNKQGFELRMMRAEVVLRTAREVVRRYCSAREEPLSSMDTYYVEEKVALSLQILGETLTGAKAKIVEQASTHIRGWYGDATDGWGIPSWIMKKQREDGWCRKAWRELTNQVGDHATALLFAYKSIESPRHHFEGHHNCDENTCKFTWRGRIGFENGAAIQPDGMSVRSTETMATTSVDENARTIATESSANRKNKYEPAHNEDICAGTARRKACEDRGMIGPPLDKVLEYLREGPNGRIPLVQFRRHDDSEIESEADLEVVKCLKHTRFATISHVWSDRYGNEEENKLWSCQLRFFRNILRAKAKLDSAQDVSEGLPFWLDTLVVPVRKDLETDRKTAIRQIPEVFSEARYTIVVDNGLIKMSKGITYEETAMRILLSNWMRRLWTLQEAYLSRDIVFQFDDGLMDVENVEEKFHVAHDKLSTHTASIARTYFHNILGEERRAKRYDHVGISNEHSYALVASVWSAAQWRTTTHPQHETLALASMLNINRPETEFDKSGLLADEDPARNELDRLMKKFWLALETYRPNSIPPGIVFLPGDKLPDVGFGWAPRTFMSAHDKEYPDVLTQSTHLAELSRKDGLLVRFPGFLLHAQNVSSILFPWDNDNEFSFPCDSTFLEWYTCRISNKQVTEYRVKKPKALAIILSRPRPKDREEIALLVEILEERNQRLGGTSKDVIAFIVKIVSRVHVRRETRDAVALRRPFEASNFEENKFICGETLDDDQRWYVGGQQSSTEATDIKSSSAPPLESESISADIDPPGKLKRSETFLDRMRPKLPKIFQITSGQPATTTPSVANSDDILRPPTRIQTDRPPGTSRARFWPGLRPS